MLKVQQSYAQALKWIRPVAEQGNPDAQNLLGTMYDDGHGVPRDYAAALKWFLASADQGYVGGQTSLGFAYVLGHGVPVDYVQAYAWFNLAAAQGEKVASDELDFLSPRMTPLQIAEAQRLSSSFRPITPTGASASLGLRPPRSAPASPSTGAAAPAHGSESVAAVQRRLRALGYSPGPTDGVAGPATIAAVRAFQRDHGMTPDGIISTTLFLQLWAPSVKEPIQPSLVATGTGFVIDRRGDLITNHHVIAGCKQVRVVTPSGAEDVAVAADSAEDDLAALRPAKGSSKAVATFGAAREVALGDDVIVAGYPLRGLLAAGLNVAGGNVSALAGIDNDHRFLQITAPVQPGNSGGPLLDQSGHVVGVVVAKLNAVKIAKLTGDIPQNVNFAIKAAVVRSFLDINGINYAVGQSKATLSNADIAAKARTFTFPVECWK